MGENGDDVLKGGGGNDVLIGDFGDDISNGGDGADYFSGGFGEGDVATYAGASARVIVNLYSGGTEGEAAGDGYFDVEDVIGTAYNDILVGSSEDNILKGEAGDDDLSGGTYGSDTLDGGVGNDTMRGGALQDTFIVDSAGDVVVEFAGEGYDTVKTSVNYTLAADVEVEVLETSNANATTAIDLTGNNLANTVIGNAGNNVLNGGGGADTLRGLGGDDTYIVDNTNDAIVDLTGTDTVNASVSYALAGGVSVDTLQTTDAAGTTALTLIGNELANIVIGNAGNNIISGGGGVDTMRGLAGNDSYFVDSNADVVVDAVGQGTDNVNASVSYVLKAGVSAETLRTTDAAGTAAINLTGNELANMVAGNAGINILNGGGGADTLQGLAGNDSYFVDNAADKIVEAAGQGTDNVNASVSYTLAAGVSAETLRTTNAAGTTAINLTGNELANMVTGNAGINILNGGSGADTLQGLAGNDSYFVDNAADKIVEAAGQGTDTVNASVSYTLAAGVSAETLRTTNAAGTAAINLTGNELANMVTGNAGNQHSQWRWWRGYPSGVGRQRLVFRR